MAQQGAYANKNNLYTAASDILIWCCIRCILVRKRVPRHDMGGHQMQMSHSGHQVQRCRNYFSVHTREEGRTRPPQTARFTSQRCRARLVHKQPVKRPRRAPRERCALHQSWAHFGPCPKRCRNYFWVRTHKGGRSWAPKIALFTTANAPV